MPTLIPIIPTEIPSSSKNMIEIARRAQQEALVRGEFKFPLPEVIKPVSIDIIRYKPTKTDVLVIRGQEREGPIIFPSLVEGKVLGTAIQDRAIRSVLIQIDDIKWMQIEFVGSGKFLTKNDAQVKLGDPIFEAEYKPTDPLQQEFALKQTGNITPDALIVIRYGSFNEDGSVSFQDLSEYNLLVGEDKKAIFIPTLASDESA